LQLPVYIQPHLITRTGDIADQLADIADAIMKTTRASISLSRLHFKFRGSRRTLDATGVADSENAASTEAKFNLQIAQLRLTL